MVIVRGQRADISPQKLLSATIDVYKDKTELSNYKNNQLSNKGNDGWDESYLDNLFLARFCNLKYNDASLALSKKIPNPDPQFIDFTFKRLLATFPAPVLSLFDISIQEKSYVNSMSFGDFLYYRAEGQIYALGGFRTGQFAGTGMATFGWWYLLVLGIAIIPVFFLVDIFYVKKNIKNSNKVIYCISICGLLLLINIFQFLSFESLSQIFSFIIRGWFQIVFLYIVLFQLTNVVQKSFQF
jgi:cytochrome c oxidase subunit IV